MRFPLEVAAAVRDACGTDGAVVYRISGTDLVEGGAAQDEVIALARRLADGIVDGLAVGIGWHEARIPTVQALVPHGAWVPWAEAIKRAVTVPVIVSNRVNTVELAEEVLAHGSADFVSLARPFLADPELVRKARSRTRERINICIACNQACIDRSIFDRRVSCVVNPRAGYELELPAAARPGAPSGRRVAVVGGGPAGMEAARALAAAGHRVELYEAAERLGGQFRMACRIPGKEDFAKTIEYFEAELPWLGVEVRLGVAIADASELEPYDGVVVATGVLPRTVELPGIDLPHVLSYPEALGGELERGAGVAVIGAGGIGVDAAHMFSHRPSADPVGSFYRLWGLAENDPDPEPARFDPVTLMCRGARPGGRIGPSTRWAVLETLKRAGVEILTGVRYERIEPGAVVIVDGDGAQRVVPAETVVVAAGQVPNASLAAALEEAGRPHVVIGGAASATELDAERAFREGALVPEKLDQLIGSPA
jgi:2,4-dienoyl-CoA reductase (NADPH2)